MPLNEDNALDYRGNGNPKCPSCDKDIDISEWELFDLCREDEHTVECPYCENEFVVISEAAFTFSSDKQP